MGSFKHGDVQAKGKYKPVSQRDFVSHAQILDRAPQKIRASPNAAFYVDAIRSRWTMQQLSDHALKYFKETISRESFRRLRQEIPPDEIIESTYRESILKDIDIKVDALVEIQNLIAVQRYRVTNAIQFESSLAAGVGKSVIPLKSTRDEIELLFLMFKDFVNIQVGIGIFGSGGRPSGNEAESTQEQKPVLPIEDQVMELRRTLTEEQYSRLVEMCRELDSAALTVNFVAGNTVDVEERARAEVLATS